MESSELVTKEIADLKENTNEDKNITVTVEGSEMENREGEIVNSENTEEKIDPLKDLKIAGSVETNPSTSDEKENNSETTTPPNDVTQSVVLKKEHQENLSIDSTIPNATKAASVFLKSSKLYQNSSLGLLASQYLSDDDTDGESKTVITEDSGLKTAINPMSYRKASSSSSDSDSDIEFIREIRNRIRTTEKDPDDDENGATRPDIPKVKGEMLVEDLPPVRDLSAVTVPEHECIKLGKVYSIVGQLVLIDSSFITLPLDLETILFRNCGNQALGEIFDVLGQVAQPLYCVRFNSNNEIQEKGINVGEIIYLAPRSEHTKYVVLSNITKIRGSDASWENDIEPPERFIEYSDDEEERAAHRMMKKINLQ